MNLSNAIQQLRTRRNESQQVFATNNKLAIRTLSNYETAQRRPSREFLTTLADLATKSGYADLADEFQMAIAESLSPGEAIDEEQRVLRHIARPSPSGNIFDALLWVTDDEHERKLLWAFTGLMQCSRRSDWPAIQKNSLRALQAVIEADKRNSKLLEAATSKSARLKAKK